MKQSPDNQINASFIDILRIKWLVFFYCGRLYKFLAGTCTLYVKGTGCTIKGIRQKSQQSERIHWRPCLLSGATEPCPLRLRETLACIHIIQHNVMPRVTCWHGSRPNSQKKNGMRVKTSADARLEKKLRVYTASDANWLMANQARGRFLKGQGNSCLDEGHHYKIIMSMGKFLKDHQDNTRATKAVSSMKLKAFKYMNVHCTFAVQISLIISNLVN